MPQLSGPIFYFGVPELHGLWYCPQSALAVNKSLQDPKKHAKGSMMGIGCVGMWSLLGSGDWSMHVGQLGDQQLPHIDFVLAVRHLKQLEILWTGTR